MIFNTIVSTAISVSLLNPLEVLITRYALVDTSKKKLVFTNRKNKKYKREEIKGFNKVNVT